MSTPPAIDRIDTVIIGAGQAGLSAGYHLSRHGVPFVILDGNDRIGDTWRRRWDSLRLFTPARFSSLDGLPFPAPPFSFPAKDAFADYLEHYAAHFSLPVRTRARVTRLSRAGDRFVVEGRDFRIDADRVVVAMADYQRPRIPPFASQLAADIVQLHSLDYRNPAQIPDGDVLLVGAGNSGSEIAIELSRTHRVWMAGRNTGHLPFRIDGTPAHLLVPLVLRGIFHRVLTRSTPLGRLVRRKILHHGGPLIRVRPSDLRNAGVIRTGRVSAADAHGRPLLDDGRALDVASVVWCTGFHPGFSWIDLPVFGADGDPEQVSGVVAREPGLFFLGLHFQHAMSSGMIHGVGRDASGIARTIAAQRTAAHARTAGERRPVTA